MLQESTTESPWLQPPSILERASLDFFGSLYGILGYSAGQHGVEVSTAMESAHMTVAFYNQIRVMDNGAAASMATFGAHCGLKLRVVCTEQLR